MATNCLIAVIVIAHSWLLPSPVDKFGWGLRIRPVQYQTCLEMECIDHSILTLALFNLSSESKSCMPLRKACESGALELSVTQPDGGQLGSICTRHVRVSNKVCYVEAANFIMCDFTFVQFGCYELIHLGTYKLRASMKTTQGLIVSPVVKLNVIEPASKDILTSVPVSLEGQFAKWPKERQDTALIQQIKIGNRTWLFYRQFSSPELGGKVSRAFRIAELPGKVVDFKVEGAFGDWNPLTITYREHTYTKWTTTHVINSVDGRPWTAEEEKHRQEKLKRDAKPPAEKK